MADGTDPAADSEETAGSGPDADPDCDDHGPASSDAVTDETVGSDPGTGTAETDHDPDADGGVDAAGGAGAATDRGTPPRAAADVEAYTTDRRTLSPRVRVLWSLRVVVGGLVVALLARVVTPRLGLDPRVGPALGVGLTILGLVWVALRYRVWAYELRADALYLQRGVVTHRRTLAPFVRVQHVDTSRGPLERGLGLSTLVVYTAGSRGADVSIPGLTPTEAADLQRRVKQLAIEAEGGDAV